MVKADRYESVLLNKAMDDIGNHYGFVTIPYQPVDLPTKRKSRIRCRYYIIRYMLDSATVSSSHWKN